MDSHTQLITKAFDAWTNALVLKASRDILERFVQSVDISIEMCIGRMRQDGRDVSSVESRRFELLELMRDIEGCTHPNITHYYAYMDITRALELLLKATRHIPEECSICMDTMRGTIAETECLHRFHLECLDRWLESHNTCPICRSHG
jgi:hypothetical protein